MTQLVSAPADHPALAPQGVRSTGRALLTDLKILTKPRITRMVIITAYVGYALALPGKALTWGLPLENGYWSLLQMIVVLGAIALCCAGSAALNQFYERDTDSLMKRTANRPLPAGRVSPLLAGVFGVTLSLLGVGILAAGQHLLAAGLAAFTVFSYALVYTPLKRVSHLSIIVGAVPGAMPPVLGYTAVTGGIDRVAVVMFGIMFLWQLPHFLAINWMYREEYARAGMPMLAVVDPSGMSTFRQSLLGCLALLPLGLLPTMMGVAGVIYFTVALIAGLVFLGTAVQLVRTRENAHARMMFHASLVYLPLVLLFLLVDRV